MKMSAIGTMMTPSAIAVAMWERQVAAPPRAAGPRPMMAKC
jgi:hypothetical protein